MKTKADQDDMAAQNAKLYSDIAALELKLQTSGIAVPPRPNIDGAYVIDGADMLAAHRAILQGKVSIGAKAPKEAAAVPLETGEPKTLTERVLTAKGCKSMAELNEKMQNRRPVEGD
jgi:hypothetical protein